MPWTQLATLLVTAKLISSAYNEESITSDCRMFQLVVRTLAIVYKTVLYTVELTQAYVPTYNLKHQNVLHAIMLCFAIYVYV